MARVSSAVLSSVEYVPEASGLVGDHLADAEVLTVASGRVFGAMGTLRVDGVDYDYWRLAGDTLNLATPLAADVAAGEPVERLSEQGGPEGRLVAFVDFDDDGESDDEAEIPAGMRGYFPEGIAAKGTVVDVESTEFGYRIVSRPYDQDALDGATVDYAATSVYLTSDMFMGPASTWTRVEWPVGTGGNRHFRAIVASSPEVVTVPTTGRYLIVGNVQWAPDNVTGGRAGRLVLIDVDGTETVLRESFHAPSPTGTSEFQVVRTKVLEAGQGVALDVRYTTGADISPANIVGSADETATALELVLVAQI